MAYTPPQLDLAPHLVSMKHGNREVEQKYARMRHAKKEFREHVISAIIIALFFAGFVFGFGNIADFLSWTE